MSTNLTVHNLDEQLVERLRAEARRRGVQVDEVVAEFLAEKLPPQLGLTSGNIQRDVSGLAGVWTDQDAREFFAAIKDLGEVDEELWR